MHKALSAASFLIAIPLLAATIVSFHRLYLAIVSGEAGGGGNSPDMRVK